MFVMKSGWMHLITVNVPSEGKVAIEGLYRAVPTIMPEKHQLTTIAVDTSLWRAANCRTSHPGGRPQERS